VGDLAGAPFEVRVDRGPDHGACRTSPASGPGGLPPFRAEPVSRLLARLGASRDPAALRAAGSIRARLAPGETLAFLDRALPGWGGAEVRAYHASTARGRRALALAARIPSLARILAAPAGPAPTREAVLAAHRPRGAAPDPGHEERVLSLDWTFESASVLRALLDLPRDWLPRAPAEREAFVRLVRAAEPVTGLLGSHAALRGSHGHWPAYLAAIAGRIGPGADLAGAFRDAADMVQAFRDEIAAPILARAGLSRGWASPYRPEPATGAAAARTLLGGKGLPAILEASRGWHRRRPEIEVAIGRMGEGRGLSWPSPFAPLTAPNGLDLVPLRTREDLRREGAPAAAGGLGHCVGGYGRACAEGRAVIVSVRRVGMRLSTVELDLSGSEPRLVQHKAALNAPAPPDAEEAADWLMARLSDGSAPVSPAWLDPAWRHRPRILLEDACGYDWRDASCLGAAIEAWSPHLTRPLRDPDALAASLAREALAEAGSAARPWRGPLPALSGRSWPVRAAAILAAPFDLAGRMAPPGRPSRVAASAMALAPMALAGIAAAPGPLAGPAVIAAWGAFGAGILAAWGNGSAGGPKELRARHLAFWLRRDKIRVIPGGKPRKLRLLAFSYARRRNIRENAMSWSAPVVQEVCVGMEVTSYESAEIDTFN
jgi:coenzyme PQQ precursor peptide PqqA